MIDDEDCHPFQSWCPDPGMWIRWYGATTRCRVVAYFSAARCRRALALRRLQEPVRQALHQRLRELGERP